MTEKNIILAYNSTLNSGTNSSDLTLLYDKFAPALLGIAMKFAADQSEAEKILIETFCYISDHLSEFDQTKNNINLRIVEALRMILKSHHLISKIENRSTVIHVNNFVQNNSTVQKDLNISSNSMIMTSDHNVVLDLVFFGGQKTIDVANKLGMEEKEIRLLLREAVNNYRNKQKKA